MSSTSTPLKVSELTFAIKNQLESRFQSVVVRGEVSNCKRQASGHIYFDLKDAQAKISAVLFKNSQWPHMRLPKEGDEVVVRGALSLYPPHGKYQIIVKKLELAGIGALLAQLEELKERLKKEGLFAQKRPLPSFPKTIGVVTSATGAVIHDIIHVLSRRLKGFHLILHPVAVQGEEAAGQIAAAIETFNRYKLADVLIVGRGGGSLEDLWPFNEECVARALFASAIPTVSSVGHETDVTLADCVADVRAPTPSAAAEIVSHESEQLLQTLKKMRTQLLKGVQERLAHARSRHASFQRHPLLASPLNLLALPMQRLDEFRSRLEQLIKQRLLHRKMVLTQKARTAALHSPTKRLLTCRERLKRYQGEIEQQMRTALLLKKGQHKRVSEQLKSLDPKRVLKRGYALLLDQKENSVIVSTRQLTPGKAVQAVLADGEKELIVHDNV